MRGFRIDSKVVHGTNEIPNGMIVLVIWGLILLSHDVCVVFGDLCDESGSS